MMLRRAARFWVLAAALVTAFGAGASAVGPRTGIAEAAEGSAEFGAAAPGAGWVCAGGGTARTGRSDAEFIDRAPQVAWRRALAGPLDEEPVTWDEWIFVSSRSEKGGRLLQMIAVSDGRIAAKREFATTSPLQMSVSAGILVVRSGTAKVTALRCGSGQLFEIWSVDLPEAADSVLAIGRDVFVRGPRSISRWRAPSRVAVWTQPGTFRGRLASRGRWLYTTAFDESGNLSVLALDKATGATAGLAVGGHHDGSLPDSAAVEPIVVLPSQCIVYHALPIPTKSGKPCTVTISPRSADAPKKYEQSSLIRIGPGAIELDDGHVMPGTPEDPVTTHDTGGQNSTILASKESDAQFVNGWDRTTAVRGGVYHPEGAIRMPDLRIRWRFPEPLVGRVVPCGRTLVGAVSDRELIALRVAETAAAANGGGTAPKAETAVPATPAAEGRVVLRTGEIRSGPLSVVRDEITIGAGAAAVKLRADRVAAAFANDGRVLFARDVDSLAEAFEQIAAARASAGMGALLQSAARLADPEFLQQFLQVGIERDASQADIDRVDARLKDLLRPGKLTKADPVAAADLRKKADALRAEERGAVIELFRAALPSLAGELRIDAVRWILRAAPGDKDAVAALRALLPADVQPAPGSNVAAEWADLAAAALRTPIRVLKPKPPSAPDLTRADRALGMATLAWRKDLIAIQSDRILVIAPADRPGPIARCIELGETVCSTLDTLFASGTARRDTREPLTILVYGTKDEFTAQCIKAGEMPPHGLENTAGFYSPQYELARLYIPGGDAEFSHLIPTFAHELTHQWIAQRCPLFRDDEQRSTITTPGYWVVEGFATFVEELELSVHTRTFDAPRATESTSIVALAPREALHPWGRLLAMPQGEFAKLNPKGGAKVKFPDRLAWHRTIDPVRMFYHQAAAASAALWNMDNGQWREKFIAYVGRHYRGERATIEEAFGVAPEELGRRIEDWCGRK